MTARHRVYARDVSLRNLGELPDYSDLFCEPRLNDLGAFYLTAPVGSRSAELLTETGGIIVTRDMLTGRGPEVVFSGFVTSVIPDAQTIEISGVSDEWVLDARAASPYPAAEGTAADPWLLEQDIRSGTASTVMLEYVRYNAADLALQSRRIPGLEVGDDPGIGLTVYGQARMISLLALMQNLALAGGGLRFRVLWNDGALVFSVTEPADRSATAVISRGRGTLGWWRRQFSRATATRVYVMGQGQGVNRQVVQATNARTVTRYGFSIEAVIDRRDAADTLVLAQEAETALTEGDESRLVTFAPIDTPTFSWGTDYDVGDLVTVVTGDGEQLIEVVRGVDLKLSAPVAGQGAAEVQPIVSTPGDVADDPASRQQRGVNRRVGNLERNIDSLAAVVSVQWNVGDLRLTTRSVAASGWHLCNGQEVNRTVYAMLFSVIGTTYGAGDGLLTFNLPDMRDRYPIGVSGSKAVGATGGAAVVDLSHSHTGAPHTHSHTHTSPAHSHSHAHTGAPHAHSHAHSGAPHTHNHTHTSPAHSHSHAHSGAPHTHNHTHTSAAHSHSHSHTSAAHSHSHAHTGAPHVHSHSHGHDHGFTTDIPSTTSLRADGGNAVASATHTHTGTTDSDSTNDSSSASFSNNTGTDATSTTPGTTGSDATSTTPSVTGADATAAAFSANTGTDATSTTPGLTGADATAAAFSANTGTDATAAAFSNNTGTDATSTTPAVTGADATAAAFSGETSLELSVTDISPPYVAVNYEIYAGV